MTRVLKVELNDRTFAALEAAKGGYRQWSRFLETLVYDSRSRVHICNMINRNFENLKTDLPPEMQGICSTLRVIALKSTNLNERELDALIQKLIKLAASEASVVEDSKNTVLTGRLEASEVHAKE